MKELTDAQLIELSAFDVEWSVKIAKAIAESLGLAESPVNWVLAAATIKALEFEYRQARFNFVSSLYESNSGA